MIGRFLFSLQDISFFPDFDDDGFIGSEDIKEIINRLTGNEKLKETDIELLIEDVSYPTSKPFK